MTKQSGTRLRHKKHSDCSTPESVPRQFPEVFELIIKCESEQQQRMLYHRLTAEGLKCRLSIL